MSRILNGIHCKMISWFLFVFLNYSKRRLDMMRPNVEKEKSIEIVIRGLAELRVTNKKCVSL